MKRASLISFIVISIVIGLSTTSCTENKYADWKNLNEDWLTAHASDSGFVQTSSGLCYKVIHQGVLRYPTSSSNIVVKYTGKLIDGEEFDYSSSYSTNLSYMIQGWIEGIPKMRVGGHFIFYVPWDLGYGKDGSGTIPPYSTLIFDVTLLGSEDQL